MTQGAKHKEGEHVLEISKTATICVAVISETEHHSFPLYWLLVDKDSMPDGAPIPKKMLKDISDVLADSLCQEVLAGQPDARAEWLKRFASEDYKYFAERQFLPGVTDNLAHTVEEALRLKGLKEILKVASGRGFLFKEKSGDAKAISESLIYKEYHPLTDRFIVHETEGDSEGLLKFPHVVLPETPKVDNVSLELDDAQLERLSKERLLALNLDEMKAIRQYYRLDKTKADRKARNMPDMPTDVELEILAQTWSEHCKHKIFNAKITHIDNSKPRDLRTETINSLYKTYIKAATKKLSQWRKDLLSVFEDNAGVVKWDNETAVCFKVETHNSPSALEPYGGALTGILGVNRDILGTGLGAKPLFNTDVFCFAYPSSSLPQRPKLLPAKAILDGVRRGVEDGGNKSGIPTVNGAIFFDPGYRAKPLVFCGTGGILPLKIKVGNETRDAVKKHTRSGDFIVMAGGRVGKDGIHGATFSSESLNEGSPLSAVQIGDPFTQKRLLDFVIDARDAGLITGITDNGAGGLSSSVGEMATITGGATIHLDRVPTKYPGLADWEIVVSESQERMTISTNDFEAMKKLADKHNVEISNIGEFNNKGYFEVQNNGETVAMLELEFLHDGCPTLSLEAQWSPAQITMKTGRQPEHLGRVLLQLLKHPNICSREPVIRQYDHEVRGQSVIKPLMGPAQKAPCDAAVLLPRLTADLDRSPALAVSNGLCPRLSEHDPYLMAQCAVDEAIRNAVCVGADPDTLSLLDNFCWPDPVYSDSNPQGKRHLAELVRCCQGLYEAVVAYGAPLISGKDSMKNNFDDGNLKLAIPPTLLVSCMGRVPEARLARSMEFKKVGDLIYILSAGVLGLAASHYEELNGWQSIMLPELDLDRAPTMYRRLHTAIKSGWIHSAHDISEGGLAVCVAESTIGSRNGATLDIGEYHRYLADLYDERGTQAFKSWDFVTRADALLFGEGPGHIVVSIDRAHKVDFERHFEGLPVIKIGEVTAEQTLNIIDSEMTTGEKELVSLSTQAMKTAWETALPFD
ncbi:MAG: phosphoribosylformylglycinamidine synthase [Cyanobacteria bacterium DS2.3.42]|nr:phosphoribosylformylglycinamidine synthase [Cyanobacteria bacterium DS2.3.42]